MAFINICINPENLQSMIEIAEIDGLTEYIANFSFTNNPYVSSFYLPEQLGLVYEHIERASVQYHIHIHEFNEATAAANAYAGTSYEDL